MSITQPHKKIVLVEDDFDFVELVRLSLAEFNVEIVHAASGLEGLKIVKEHEPDLIMLDLMMPVMNGWDFYRNLKANTNMANIPVLVMTALRMRGDRYFGTEIAKVEAYLNKPFMPSKLRERVAALLAFNNLPAAA